MSPAQEAISKLQQYAYVRDRDSEKEPRTITLTDDEAAAILTFIGFQEMCIKNLQDVP